MPFQTGAGVERSSGAQGAASSSRGRGLQPGMARASGLGCRGREQAAPMGTGGQGGPSRTRGAPCCSFGAVTQGRCMRAAGWRVQKHGHACARAMQEVRRASPRLGACTHTRMCSWHVCTHTHRCGLSRCIPVSCMATQGLTRTPTHVHAHSHTCKCCSGENPNFDALETSDRAWCSWGPGARRRQSRALQSAEGKQESERGRAGNRLLLERGAKGA